MNEAYETDSEEEIASVAAAYVVFSGEFLKRYTLKRRRRWWVLPLRRSRKRCDVLANLLKEPSGINENFCRMSSTDFECLLSKIGSHIAKRNTNMRKSIPIQERLAVTLRFFATGDSYTKLANLSNLSTQSVSRCVDEVCKALIQELQEEVKLPENEDEWLNIAQGYETQWNFPNCVGAIDGKHVLIQRSGTATMDERKKEVAMNVVLLALVNARYCFTFVDIGCQSSMSDGGVFNNSSLFSKLQAGQLNLPPDKQLPSYTKKLPYVFLGDSACTLNRHMMKPYPGVLKKGSVQSVFNYRLSRAHRVVENVFGVMASIFRIFRKPMVIDPEKVSNVTLACVLLHNFMRRNPSSASSYTPPGTFDTEIDGEMIPGSWRNDQSGMTSFVPIKKTAIKSEEGAEGIRYSFAEYFTTSNKLPWQYKYC